MRIGHVVGMCAVLALAGCSGGAFRGLDQANTSGGVAGARLTGSVHGGQQPIVGAQVYLFAAATTGYGGAGIAASASNASVSLLTSGAGRTLDSSGGATNGDYYVTTDANGVFTITGDYTCTAGQQVYLYALGGNPGSGTNSAAGLIAVLGNCPAAGNFAAATPFIMVNEVSTVAAAYSMAGFATDATHVGSSGTALALTGIANAFANPAQLETLATGIAQYSGPASNLPYTLNTVADMLAVCVNSTGAGSATCSTLFANTLSGGATGTQATDTASSAINIAHHPWTNVSNLYAMVPATPPFLPVIFDIPSTYMLSVDQSYYPALEFPSSMAIDGSGNVWVTSNYPDSVGEMSNAGLLLTPNAGFAGNGIKMPTEVAIDLSGNAWVTNNSGNSVSEFLASGAPALGSPFTGGGLSSPGGIAIDGLNNVWVTNGTNSVTELTSAGTPATGSPFTGGGLSFPGFPAFDASGNLWIPNQSGNTVTELTSAGTPVPNTPFAVKGNSPAIVVTDYSGGAWVLDGDSTGQITRLSPTGAILRPNLPFSRGVSIDGGGNLWCLISGVVLEFTPAGIEINQGDPASSGSAVAVDGSGNVWVAHFGGIVEFIGAAVPVVTPISVAVKTNALGTRP
jgi:hypothetical protein